MMYKLKYTEEVVNDFKRLQRNEPKAYQKVRKFIAELK